MKSPIRIFFYVMFYFALMGVADGISGILGNPLGSDLIRYTLYFLISLLLVYLPGKRNPVERIKEWMPAEEQRRSVYFGSLAGGIVGVGAIGLTMLAGKVYLNYLQHDVLRNLLIYGILFNILQVAGQEFFFRGHLLEELRKKYSDGGAAVGVALFFMLGSLDLQFSTPISLFNALLVGLFSSVLVLKRRNIVAAICFNFVVNLLTKVIYFGEIEQTMTLSFMLILGIGILTRKTKIESENFWKWGKRSFGTLLILAFLTGAYVVGDTLLWVPEKMKEDGAPLKTVEPFVGVNSYDMELELLPKSRELTAHEKVDFINSDNTALTELHFYIYPNAMKKDHGRIVFSEILLNGKAATYRIEGTDETTLVVVLDEPLNPRAHAQVEMKFTLGIPYGEKKGFVGRLAYGDSAVNLGNFFPIAAVYENGWENHIYDEKGDAFYSETGNYRVQMTLPKSMNLAATGIIESETLDGEKKIYQIRANRVRDFAMVASEMFKVEQTSVEGTRILSYGENPMKVRKALEVGVKSIKLFNEKYGEYPYPTLSIVQTDLSGGMEYPNLVMIESGVYGNLTLNALLGKMVYGKVNGAFDLIISHEIGHQWWYALVGDDEYREAWIDEPLAQFSDLLYFRTYFGEGAYKRMLKYDIELAAERTNAFSNKSLRRPLNEFQESEYYSLIYGKGAAMVVELEKTLGEEKFFFFLQELVTRYQYGVVTGEAYMNLVSEIAGQDMSGFFEKWLGGAAYVAAAEGPPKMLTATYDVEKLYSHKSPYIGDASNIGGLVQALPSGIKGKLYLTTDREPYGVKYDFNGDLMLLDSDSEHRNMVKILRKNAAVIFALIDNADFVEVSGGPEATKKLTREEIQQDYRMDFREIGKSKERFAEFLNYLQLDIQTAPEEYGPEMSSTVGISIVPYYPGAAEEIRFSTNSGRLLRWNSADGKVTEAGNTVTVPYPSHDMYWSPLTSLPISAVPATHEVRVEILGKGTVLATKILRFDNTRNGMYRLIGETGDPF